MRVNGKDRYIQQEGLPHSPDCERAILGAILLDNDCFNQAASVLIASDFALDSHQKLFSRMLDLASQGSPIDYVTVTEQLLKAHQLENIGGAVYVTSLTDGLPRVKNIEEYVNIVREKARARMLLNAAEVVKAQITELELADDVLEYLQQRLLEILYHGRAGKSRSVADICREALTELHAIRNSTGECIGKSFGIPMLDALTTGFRNSEFYVIGARPGNGKTAWMCQSARENVKRGSKPSIFSVEVPRTQIINRMACMETGISVFDTRDPRSLSAVDMERLNSAIGEIASWEMFIEDSPRMTLKQLSAIARMHISQGADIIYVDFLQKLRAPGKSEYDRVTAIADGLWELGRSTDVPIVALSQLKRNNNEVPTLEDLRSSGEIEQNANAVCLLWRPIEIDPVSQMKRHTKQDQIIIAKQRSGISETHVPVEFNGRVGYFEERIELS